MLINGVEREIKRGANLRSADLWRADLGGADLGGADLGGADLTGANLTGADLTGANLTGADLWGANLWVSHFSSWQVFLNKDYLRIGCEAHTLAGWKKERWNIAKKHGVLEEFKLFWPVIMAALKTLPKK